MWLRSTVAAVFGDHSWKQGCREGGGGGHWWLCKWWRLKSLNGLRGNSTINDWGNQWERKWGSHWTRQRSSQTCLEGKNTCQSNVHTHVYLKFKFTLTRHFEVLKQPQSFLTLKTWRNLWGEKGNKPKQVVSLNLVNLKLLTRGVYSILGLRGWWYQQVVKTLTLLVFVSKLLPSVSPHCGLLLFHMYCTYWTSPTVLMPSQMQIFDCVLKTVLF